MGALERLGIKGVELSKMKSGSFHQFQTADAFDYKWKLRETYESSHVKGEIKKWLIKKYGDGNPEVVDKWLKGGRKIILDAGCGSGFSALLLFGEHLKEHDYLGVDISDAVEIARQRFREAGVPADFLKTDILNLPIPEESIDIIFAEGVLHHTDDTEKALKYLSLKLKKGGRFLFYVYKKKGPIREFSDDYIREKLRHLSNEEAWEALIPLTKLGQTLGESNVIIDIPDDIPFLEIPAGKITLQRFIYYYIFKAFYKPDWTIEEMNHINFDWYRPLNCHRHTPEEIQKWCEKSNLQIERIYIEDSGISVVAVRKANIDEA